MFDHLNVVATAVFVFFFGLVSTLGFVAARWKRRSRRAVIGPLVTTMTSIAKAEP